MLQKLPLLYHTVKHLKPIQIKYQLLYRLKKAESLSAYRTEVDLNQVEFLNFVQEPPVYPVYFGKNTFEFLNKQYDFGEEIDWQFQDYGALWNYNLQYLNVLLQEEVALKEKLRLVNSIYSSGIVLEPYPVSLRSINVIRLISKENLEDSELLENLYAELNFLSQRLEFHLLGNHLLENGFALMMGGAFFQNKEWLKTAQGLLHAELEEQIMTDGAHFELSPMYHQIIFFRVLELVDWYSSWKHKEVAFEQFLREKASKMLAWLQHISFKNGDIPHFNDSAIGIAYSTKWLSAYAAALGIEKITLPLSVSGYRTKSASVYECKIDFAQIGPSYQPGHAHADALSFILYHQEKPLLVEQGTSTYAIGQKRMEERSTRAHNTVVVNNQNQSEVWSGFRVGNRARTTLLEDQPDFIKAKHDGYKKLGTEHSRSFQFSAEEITIKDTLSNNKSGIAYFHLYPEWEIKRLNEDLFELKEGVQIKFANFAEIQIKEYQMADGYYRYRIGKLFKVSFTGQLTTLLIVK